MIVDCHPHLVPPSLLAAIRKDAAKFPNVRQIEAAGSLTFSFSGGKPPRPASKPQRRRLQPSQSFENIGGGRSRRRTRLHSQIPC